MVSLTVPFTSEQGRKSMKKLVLTKLGINLSPPTLRVQVQGLDVFLFTSLNSFEPK
jgi:hypothetical protein